VVVRTEERENEAKMDGRSEALRKGNSIRRVSEEVFLSQRRRIGYRKIAVSRERSPGREICHGAKRTVKERSFQTAGEEPREKVRGGGKTQVSLGKGRRGGVRLDDHRSQPSMEGLQRGLVCSDERENGPMSCLGRRNQERQKEERRSAARKMWSSQKEAETAICRSFGE